MTPPKPVPPSLMVSRVDSNYRIISKLPGGSDPHYLARYIKPSTNRSQLIPIPQDSTPLKEEFPDTVSIDERFDESKGCQQRYQLPVTAVVPGKIKVALRTEGDTKLILNNVSVYKIRRRAFFKGVSHQHAPWLEHEMTQFDQFSDFIVIQMINKIPKKNSFKTLLRIVQMIP